LPQRCGVQWFYWSRGFNTLKHPKEAAHDQS
jgi:hypothetical protein